MPTQAKIREAPARIQRCVCGVVAEVVQNTIMLSALFIDISNTLVT
jgi:hypothetical protein